MTPVRYAILGTLALLLALLLNAPAATLYAWAHQEGTPVELHGLDGSLRQGTLSAAVWNRQPLLSDLQWRFRPWWLLAGRLDFKVAGGGEQALVDGKVGVGVGGRMSLRDLKFSTGLKPLLAAAGYPLPWVDGRAELEMALLKMRHGVPKDAEGRVVLNNLSWGMGPQAAPLGDIAADVARDGEALVAKLASVSGPLELAGEARLTDDGSYELKVQYKPRPDAPPAVQNLVRQGGNPDAQGFYRFERRGSLKPP